MTVSLYSELKERLSVWVWFIWLFYHIMEISWNHEDSKSTLKHSPWLPLFHYHQWRIETWTLVIARFLAQYDQFWPSFNITEFLISYWLNLLTFFWVSHILPTKKTAKCKKREKYRPHYTRFIANIENINNLLIHYLSR